MNATAKMIEEREQVCAARNTYSTLDAYARDQIACWGTAFTTYEDKGEVFCRELRRLCEVDRKAAFARMLARGVAL